MTPKDIGAIIDTARARRVMSLSFTDENGCQVAFTLHPDEPQPVNPVEQSRVDEETEWGHSGFVPPDLEAHRLMAALLSQEESPD